MEYAPPNAIHFFSYETRVSLELPDGWDEDDIGERHVIYALDPFEAEESGMTYPPKFIVKVVDVSLADPGAYLELAQQLVSLPTKGLEIISHDTGLVDGFDSVIDTFTYHEDAVDSLVTQYQVFAQVGQVVFSLTGMVDVKHKDSYLPVFRKVVESVRFIVPWTEEEQQ